MRVVAMLLALAAALVADAALGVASMLDGHGETALAFAVAALSAGVGLALLCAVSADVRRGLGARVVRRGQAEDEPADHDGDDLAERHGAAGTGTRGEG